MQMMCVGHIKVLEDLIVGETEAESTTSGQNQNDCLTVLVIGQFGFIKCHALSKALKGTRLSHSLGSC